MSKSRLPFSLLLLTNQDFKCFKKNFHDRRITNSEAACNIRLIDEQIYHNEYGGVSVSKSTIDDVFAKKIEQNKQLKDFYNVNQHVSYASEYQLWAERLQEYV